MIPPLTNSEMSSFLNCRRGWWLRYYRRLRVRSELPSLPNIGNMYHYGLEGYYRAATSTADPPRPSDLVMDYVKKQLEEYPEFADQIGKDAEMALIMLEGYSEWLEETGADAGYTILSVEQPVEVALEGTPFRLRGKIDAVVRREHDNALLQLEHKTVANLVDIPKYAQTAPQFLTYDLLAHLKSRDDPSISRTDGVLVNMAKRVKRTVKAKPPFYARHPVYHNIDELRAHYRHVVSIGWEIARIRDWLDNGQDHQDFCPPNVSRNHTWSCPCAQLGSMFDDGSDVEGFLQDFWEEHDPWQRYATEEGGDDVGA